MNQQFIITPSHFFKLDKNPLWIWHDAFSDVSKKEPLSEFVLKIMEDGNLHEKDYIATISVDEVKELDPEKGFQATLSLMHAGVPLIYQGWLEHGNGDITYRGRPDLLEKQPGKSKFGDWIYVPLDVKSSSEPKTLHKQQLSFYCMMLEAIQGHRPSMAAIVNRNFEQREFPIEEKILAKTDDDIQEIVAILKGKKPCVHISSSAKETPWYKECLREAEEQRDISLIYKLRRDTAEALREIGIDTIEKLAAQDIDALPKIPGASYDTLCKAKIQAQSLVEHRPIFIGTPDPIDGDRLKLYFDIEGDPWLGAEYLFGFWIVGDSDGKYAHVGRVVRSEEDNGKYFLYFLAEDPEKEASMWSEFLDWLRILPPEYRVYHYASYEKTAVKKLSEKHQSSEELQRFQERLFDLRKCVDKCVVFPLYFYSIKDIAKSSFVNFKWRHAKAGGGQSIFWYEKWLEAQDRQILQDIIDYNEDDVRATEYLHLWINSAAKEGGL